MGRKLRIKAVGTVFDPEVPTRVIGVLNADSDTPLYRVFLYLDGDDLPFVKEATYHLHPTFQAPIQTVRRSIGNPKCKLQIWTWGLFVVQVVVLDSRGGQTTLQLELRYDEEFDAPGAYFEHLDQ